MLITIGKALKPWGIKGEVKVRLMPDFPERFKELDRVYLTSPAGKEIVCRVMSVRYSGKAPLILFKEYDTPEKAKAISGWLIQVPKEEAAPPPGGSFYRHELIGMEVFSEAGEKLGTITDIFETGSNDVYVMKSGGKKKYIPAPSGGGKES